MHDVHVAGHGDAVRRLLLMVSLVVDAIRSWPRFGSQMLLLVSVGVNVLLLQSMLLEQLVADLVRCRIRHQTADQRRQVLVLVLVLMVAGLMWSSHSGEIVSVLSSQHDRILVQLAAVGAHEKMLLVDWFSCHGPALG